jgi:hypothetical protein
MTQSNCRLCCQGVKGMDRVQGTDQGVVLVMTDCHLFARIKNSTMMVGLLYFVLEHGNKVVN